jgi:hypothetical protein
MKETERDGAVADKLKLRDAVRLLFGVWEKRERELDIEVGTIREQQEPKA